MQSGLCSGGYASLGEANAGAIRLYAGVSCDVAGAAVQSPTVLVGSALGDIGGMAVAVVILLALALVVVALWQADVQLIPSRRESSPPAVTDSGTEPVPETELESSPVDQATGSAVDDGGGPAQSTKKPRTDSETIVELLERNDGQMRQAAIVADTEWSKSKVSMVLSEMEENGDISKLRVGRENIVSLRGSEPEAARSPFENE